MLPDYITSYCVLFVGDVFFRETNWLSLSDPPPTDVPSDIYSDILSHIIYIPTFYLIFWHSTYHSIWHILWVFLACLRVRACPCHELLGDYFSWQFHESCPHHELAQGGGRRNKEGQEGRSEGVAPVNLETLTWQVVGWNSGFDAWFPMVSQWNMPKLQRSDRLNRSPWCADGAGPSPSFSSTLSEKSAALQPGCNGECVSRRTTIDSMSMYVYTILLYKLI